MQVGIPIWLCGSAMGPQQTPEARRESPRERFVSEGTVVRGTSMQAQRGRGGPLACHSRERYTRTQMDAVGSGSHPKRATPFRCVTLQRPTQVCNASKLVQRAKQSVIAGCC